jgi:N-methylhydantoinase A
MQVGPERGRPTWPGLPVGENGGHGTDAVLVVGLLGEKTALGGELMLIRDLAEAAIGRLAAALGVAPLAVADGIIQIVGTHVTGAVREITVEQGHDPADFGLLAYGGGGGMIAGDVARELGIPRVIVPPGPGAFSAFGMLLTDVIHDFAQTWVAELGRADPPS